MKRVLIILLSLLSCFAISAQSYNTQKVSLTNYLVRMYNSAPFEGVRVVDDYDFRYLISVLSLNKSKYDDESTMNKVASVKAMSQASRFFSGSRISSELIIRTSDKSDGTSDTEIIENIQENSVGYVKSLELLTCFPQKETNEVVFIFITSISQTI